MRRLYCIFVVLLSINFIIPNTTSFSQTTILLPDSILYEIIAETSGEIALNNEKMLAPFERNRPEREYTGLFWESEFMIDRLKEYGFSDVHVEAFESNGTQWDAVKGKLTVKSPFKEVIADHDAIAASLARNSADADVETELVYIPNGSNASNYEGVDVAGKVVLSEGSMGSLYRTAVGNFGAAGVVAYETPHPDLHQDVIVWNSVSRSRDSAQGFGFNLLHPKGCELVEMLKNGTKIRVHAEIVTKQYPAKLEVVTAAIPGTDRSDQELLLIAHLFEGISKQGANDNYSGSVCILETGRTILELIRRGIIEQPRRTIRFLWVPEISGTRAYIQRYPEEIKKMIAGINMDMVGEDLFKTRSIFYISRTFHSLPSFFNDIVQEFAELTVRLNNDAHHETYGELNLKITAPTGSKVPFLMDVIGYDSGSDHGVLSNGVVQVPTVYFECWPDDFYHSNMDVPDKTDPTQLKRVAFIAAASIVSAASAKSDDVLHFVTLINGKGRKRIAEGFDRAQKLLISADANTILQSYKKAKILIEQAVVHEIDILNTLEIIAENNQLAKRSIAEEVVNLKNENTALLATLQNRCKVLCENLGVTFVEPKLTTEEIEMSKLIPARKETDMLEQMNVNLRPDLQRSHDVYRYRYVTNELVNYIDGERSILEIAHAVMAELGGPDPKDVAEYYYVLEKQGSIQLIRK